MNEYSIPECSGYKIREDGQIVSYKGKKPKILKRYKKPRYGCGNLRETQILRTDDGRTITRTINRIQLASILGRWPEPWEQARHLDGDAYNNSRSNIAIGCRLLNAIDDVELGVCKTSVEFIDDAIARLKVLREAMA